MCGSFISTYTMSVSMVHANCTLYDKEWCRLSQHTLVSSIKTKYDYNITEISWKVALNITKGLGLDNSVA